MYRDVWFCSMEFDRYEDIRFIFSSRVLVTRGKPQLENVHNSKIATKLRTLYLTFFLQNSSRNLFSIFSRNICRFYD